MTMMMMMVATAAHHCQWPGFLRPNSFCSACWSACAMNRVAVWLSRPTIFVCSRRRLCSMSAAGVAPAETRDPILWLLSLSMFTVLIRFITNFVSNERMNQYHNGNEQRMVIENACVQHRRIKKKRIYRRRNVQQSFDHRLIPNDWQNVSHSARFIWIQQRIYQYMHVWTVRIHIVHMWMGPVHMSKSVFCYSMLSQAL